MDSKVTRSLTAAIVASSFGVACGHSPGATFDLTDAGDAGSDAHVSAADGATDGAVLDAPGDAGSPPMCCHATAEIGGGYNPVFVLCQGITKTVCGASVGTPCGGLGADGGVDNGGPGGGTVAVCPLCSGFQGTSYGESDVCSSSDVVGFHNIYVVCLCPRGTSCQPVASGGTTGAECM